MDSLIKNALKTSVLKKVGAASGGCINEGEIYLTDFGKVFIKKNQQSKAREMFDGEYESLIALSSTNTVRVPKPFHVIDNPGGGAVLILEYLDIKSLRGKASLLGDQLARLHMHNIQLRDSVKCQENYVGSEEENKTCVSKFGFHIDTSCGYIAQKNSWCEDWVTFYTRKLEQQINLIEKEYGDREARSLWSVLSTKIPHFFSGMEIFPSLLHGDLWSGNAGETNEEPVIFDPASFYGHHEFDLSISSMFGGFSTSFWDAYHRVIPRQEGFEQRQKLYKLFHNLNHWNHFGSGYRNSSLEIMKQLSK